jgi:hypothetical protein
VFTAFHLLDSPIYNIDEPTNRLINDGNERYRKIYTFNFTSSSTGVMDQFPPVFSGDL